LGSDTRCTSKQIPTALLFRGLFKELRQQLIRQDFSNGTLSKSWTLTVAEAQQPRPSPSA